jgi:nitroimidazol reductase NimA-like FMN-containing flavoprotein (pyridoxamine 5'-phosphate oxidase superfamily)
MSSYGLEVLDADECNMLLDTESVGRVATGGDDPIVVPVVYKHSGGTIVFRTAPGDKLIAAALRRTVAFEIDHFDVDSRSGWSVLVVGQIEEIVNARELEEARNLALEPWAGEVRDRFVRIRPAKVTGRRIVRAEDVSR